MRFLALTAVVKVNYLRWITPAEVVNFGAPCGGSCHRQVTEGECVQ